MNCEQIRKFTGVCRQIKNSGVRYGNSPMCADRNKIQASSIFIINCSEET